MKTIVMKPYLSYLPPSNDNNHNRESSIDMFIEQIKNTDFLNHRKQPSIGYGMLNICAIKQQIIHFFFLIVLYL